MLYEEFLIGTGCKMNEHNYKVYKDLEVMYMNSDISKEQVYEYGKKLVNNDKSQAELEFENKIKADIKACKLEIKRINEDVKKYKEYLAEAKEAGSEFMEDTWKGLIKTSKDEVKYWRRQIKRLEFCLDI